MLTSTNNFIYSQTITNGLLLEDPNTGSGKSYYSCQAIYDYVHSTNAKQVYFTTSLLKNLCISEMKDAYKKHNNPNYDKEVLEIREKLFSCDYVLNNCKEFGVIETDPIQTSYETFDSSGKRREFNNEIGGFSLPRCHFEGIVSCKDYYTSKGVIDAFIPCKEEGKIKSLGTIKN